MKEQRDKRKEILAQFLMVGGAYIASLIVLNFYVYGNIAGVICFSLYAFIVPHRYGFSEFLDGTCMIWKYFFLYMIPALLVVFVDLLLIYDFFSSSLE